MPTIVPCRQDVQCGYTGLGNNSHFKIANKIFNNFLNVKVTLSIAKFIFGD